jgi:hypothetical protein
MEDKFCIIGNSHTGQFNNPKLNVLWGYGASICGLYNENSILQLKQKILNYQDQNPDKTLVFFLGQSDIEFIYYFKSITTGEKINIDTFIDTLVIQYVDFIKKYIKKPIILGINPIVIGNIKRTFNVNFREQSTVNPAGRTLSHIQYEDVKHFYDNFEIRFNNNLNFNKKLKIKCEQNSIIYTDLNDILFNDDKLKYIYEPKDNDHHLVSSYELYNILIDKIKEYI